jgi:hypothetical protein
VFETNAGFGVTSVNSISPEGRGGVGLGDGEAAATCSAARSPRRTRRGCLHEQQQHQTH